MVPIGRKIIQMIQGMGSNLTLWEGGNSTDGREESLVMELQTIFLCSLPQSTLSANYKLQKGRDDAGLSRGHILVHSLG